MKAKDSATSPSAEEPDIFQCSNFRTFLKDYFEFKKKKNAKYSFTVFSKQLGFSSRSFIQDVISGKKNVSLEALERFKILFPRHLDKFEHFRKLVLRDQAKSSTDKKYFDTQINFERAKSKHDMPSLEYLLYSDWYFVPIFFLACDPEFKDDDKWIAQKLSFKTTPAQIKHAVQSLYSLNYWQKDSQGKTRIQFETINSHAEVDRNALKRFHARMLEIAREAAEFPFHERILNASTLLLDETQVNELRDKIFKFKESELQSYQGYNLENSPKKRVYHFQFAVFPLTKPMGK